MCGVCLCVRRGRGKLSCSLNKQMHFIVDVCSQPHCVLLFNTFASDLSRNSHSRSMSSKQDTDSDTQEPNNSSCKSSERSVAECPQHNNSVSVDTSTRQPAKPSQMKRNLSYGDNSDPALEPSSLPPPDPWLETSSTSPSEPIQPGACRRDGYWFLKLLQAETERLEGWCRQMDQETKENNLSEEGRCCQPLDAKLEQPSSSSFEKEFKPSIGLAFCG